RRAAFPAQLEAEGLAPRQRHVLEQQPQHAFAIASGRAGILPHAREIGRERVDSALGLVAERAVLARRRASVLLFGVRQRGERGIPLPLELVGDQPMLWTDTQELALRELGLLPRPLDTGA